MLYVAITLGCAWCSVVHATPTFTPSSVPSSATTYTLRIDNLVNTNYLIYLAEIEAFSGSTKLTPISTYMSSTYGSSLFPLSDCFDGLLYSTWCASQYPGGVSSVYLTATYSILMDRIVVTNNNNGYSLCSCSLTTNNIFVSPPNY